MLLKPRSQAKVGVLQVQSQPGLHDEVVTEVVSKKEREREKKEREKQNQLTIQRSPKQQALHSCPGRCGLCERLQSQGSNNSNLFSHSDGG